MESPPPKKDLKIHFSFYKLANNFWTEAVTSKFPTLLIFKPDGPPELFGLPEDFPEVRSSSGSPKTSSDFQKFSWESEEGSDHQNIQRHMDATLARGGRHGYELVDFKVPWRSWGRAGFMGASSRAVQVAVEPGHATGVGLGARSKERSIWEGGFGDGHGQGGARSKSGGGGGAGVAGRLLGAVWRGEAPGKKKLAS